MSHDLDILPVILSGGSGSRLWPLSTPEMPKQLLPLMGERTMIQDTADRFAGMRAAAVICNAAHADVVADQVEGDGAILLEPCPRNTAPAAAVAALHAQSIGAEFALLAPADHHVADPDAFRDAVRAALPAARQDRIVTFGITPDRPETGYGYIRMGDPVAGDVRRVEAFVEKPDFDTAQAYLASRDYAWNAGLFLFKPSVMIAEMQAHAPDILASARDAYDKAVTQGRRIALDAESFGGARSQSIDYAVMEPTAHAACLSVDMGWSDIGSYESLLSARRNDMARNALADGTRCVASTNCLVDSDGPRVNIVGLDNVGVIVRDGEVLVVNLFHSQRVKEL